MTIDKNDARAIYGLIALIANPDKARVALDALLAAENTNKQEDKRLQELAVSVESREKDLVRRERLLFLKQTELDVAAAALSKREVMIADAEKKSAERILNADQQARDYAARTANIDAVLAEAEQKRKQAAENEKATAAARAEVERRLERIRAAAA